MIVVFVVSKALVDYHTSNTHEEGEVGFEVAHLSRIGEEVEDLG